MSFLEIAQKFKRAEPGSDDAARALSMFDDETYNWAELVIDIHLDKYGIDKRNRSVLWESAKRANLDMLERTEPEIFSSSRFLDFYLFFIHQSLLDGYFEHAPRLAEIIRKNVKRRVFETEIIEKLKSGGIRSMSGRKVQVRSANPPVWDAWIKVADNNYPASFKRINELQSGKSGDKELTDSNESPASRSIDSQVRSFLWDEIRKEVESCIDNGWPYERQPFQNPGMETRNFFRTTLNWFILNHLHQSRESGETVERLINNLEKKERYNVEIGQLEEEWFPALMKAFRENGPSDFYKDKFVGVKGRNYGMLFDKVANALYNIILFPDLAQAGGEDWGVEKNGIE